ncbi:MAG: LysR family transcriptional regulator [Acidocella sp. 20-63-7]|nr:MAG: LysR family transcriptional regulator [Acidocella sp. 20-63-7]HQT47805.1 LysR family transcriptional regulator [Acidocella sp.]
MAYRLAEEWFLRSRLKLRHLRLLVTLDEQRNLHRAAEEMGIAQPAASKLLAEIEDILRLPLFERHPRGLSPNVQGEMLIRSAKVVLRTLVQAGEEIAAFSNGDAGTVTVGTVMAPMVELLVEAIDRVRKTHPSLRITVELDVSDMLANRLLEGAIDFSLARIPHDMELAQFEYQELWGENIHFLCREGHPLAGRKDLTFRDLAACVWVLQPRGTPLRQVIERAYLSAGLGALENVINSTSAVMAMVMVDRSDAITAMEKQVAKLLSGVGRFRILDLKQDMCLEPYGLLRLSGRPLSPGARILYDAIADIAATQRVSRQAACVGKSLIDS